MKYRITLIFLFLSWFAKADQTIFPLNSVWKYLDNGTDQGTAWRAVAFNDASWASGPGELGYGDGDEATVVSYGPNASNKYITTYFRKSVNIADVSAFTSFQLGVKRDDGVVVYVNGTEVWRDNINGTVSYNTLAASDASDDGSSVLTATIPTSYFVNGTNVIAVEIHQFTVSSSDISFDMRLIGLESPPPSNQTIFPFNSVWKYLDNGTDQGTAWRAVGFNDASWASGPGELGYGDGDEATVVSYGPNAANKYITTYFRKSVNIADVSAFTSFQLGVKRDDGVVVYVNGTEVWRDNINGTVSYNTLAAADASDDGSSVLTATLPTSYFVNGTNVIAVEIHQFTVNSSDISFDMSLTGLANTPPPVPVVTRGAYLNVATPTSIIVRYRTDITTASKIVYGVVSGTFTDSVMVAGNMTEHVVQLSGLQPNTKYYYAIKSGNSFLQNNATENFFITPPVAGTVKPTRIWVLGDMGFGTVEQNQVRDAYYNFTGNTYTDLWLWLGDNAYNSGTDAEYQNYVFSNRYEKMLRQTVVWPAAGNHDLYAANAVTETGPYYEMFSFPTNAEAGGLASGRKAYYSYNYANIHFVVLESTTASFRTIGGAMMNWLQADLAANTQKWTIVYFHHPPYSKGSHNSDTETELIQMRQNFNPILEQYKVDLVLCGHSHNYERTYLIKDHFGLENTFSNANKVDGGGGGGLTPYYKTATNNFNGTVYAVAGTGGVIEGTSPGWPHDAMYTYSDSKYGSMVVDVNGDTLNARFIDNTLPSPVVYDQFSIIKQCNQPVSLSPFNDVCAGVSPFALAGGSPSGGVYSGPGVSNGTFSPAIAGVGTHTITYTYTNGFCVNTATATITVTSGGQIASVTPTGSQSICAGSALQLSANTGSGFTYQWKKDGVNINGATQPTYMANVAGSYTVVVTSACGSATSAATIITVGSLTASVTPSGTVNLCSAPATLTANSGTGFTYQWYKDGVVVSGANASTLQIINSGSYSVVITNAAGCTATSNSVNATGNTHIISAQSSTTICAGSSVVLSAPTGVGYTYQWYRNNSAISGAISSNYSASSDGIYYCKVTVLLGLGCTGNSNTLVVSVINNPTPTISANGSTAICSGNAVLLSTNTFAGVSYQWERNGTNIAGATAQDYNATLAGTYRVTHTANGCSKKSPALSVTVSAGPSASITANGSTQLCNGQTVTLKVAVVSGATYQWIKDGSIINGATTTSYVANASGTYQCRVTTSCTSISNAITVTAATLQASIAPNTDQTICSGSNVLFTVGNIAGSTYQWNFNGGAISGATQSSFNATAAGAYSVTVSNSCGSITSASVNVIVHDATASINPSIAQTICPGGSVSFSTTLVNGFSYQWLLNGNAITGANQSTYQASVAGNYAVQITNACGTLNSVSVPVTISSTPTATISPSTAQVVCSGGSLLFTANSGSGLTYQWNLNGNPISGASQSSYAATDAGLYSVTVSSACGSATSSAVQLTVESLTAVISPASNQSICQGSSVQLSANTGNGLSYQWYKDGSMINGANQSVYSAASVGAYTVVVTNNCGSSTSNAVQVDVVVVNSAVTPSGTTSVCSGVNQQYIVNPTPGATYQWYRNNVLISGAVNNTYSASSSGQYYVRIQPSGCAAVNSNTAILNVQTNTTPTFTSSAGTAICNGQSTTLTSNTYAGVSFQWQREKVNIAGATSQTYVATTGGQYRVIQTYNGCSRTSAETKLNFISCRLEGYADQEETIANVVVYPNPFSKATSIKISGFDEISTRIKVFDILGKEITELKAEEGVAIWNKGDYKPGIYLIKVYDDHGNQIVKRVQME